ncbi:choice-of-anchor L domain-containing protein [Algibacter sp. 2305UL17-15]|uniref:T9SS type B sorting domain-containing protein n=1 Tax=Algibacter sp. 2305UL17-15 TaxID=3231268 RepID=UPI00345B3006
MKKPLHFYIFIATLVCCFNTALSQQISVNGNVTIRELIEDNLVDGCVEVSNITSAINGNATGFRSYAEFSRGSSNFPFENGIMLSTGAAESGGNNLTTTPLSEGATTWGTDPDLETALGITNTSNATSIEFDFISISSQVQFNYLLASEEYSGINPCNVSDGFAFLIREVGSAGPYQNIAVVPGTATPVNTNTVHDEIVGVCAAQNEQYFDGYNIGDTNYNGRTEVFTASATITPYVQYHIKLVIADGFDQSLDSAVFIEGDSFKILDLGEDIDTCAQSVPLNADIGNPTSTYEWFFNGNTDPIPGQTDPILDVTQSGTYRVVITNRLNSSDCLEEDEIVVHIQNEITFNPLSDYILCDDLSGDETETFDLSTKDAELAGVITFTNYNFSYHLSDSDARNDIGAITTPIQNTSPTQPIFIRIDDMDSGCIAYSTFNLVVSPIPNIIDPTNLPVCDSDNDPSDGFTTINLREKDDEITNSQSGLVVSYHYNSLDTTTGNNPIPDPENYVNTNTPTETIYVRVVNSATGCYNNSSLTIDITNGPVVNREPIPLDGCDTDHDGIDNFDLTQAISDILAGLTGTTTTFHETTADAEEGINAIADETNYQNITPDVQTVFVRVEDNVTGCASIVPLQIHTNLLLTGTDLGDFALCDDPSNDGTINFNLFIIESFIANDLPNITVTFYETQADFDTNNPLDKHVLYTASNPTTLLVSIENGSCNEVDEIKLIVNPVLVFNPITPVEYCDDDDDGIVSIDLTSFDDLITGGNTDFSVFYFGSQTDAETNFNPHPPFYTNSQPQETIYARVENEDTGCFTVNPFDISVVPAPTITNPDPWLICDTDQDGMTILNLEDKIPDIVTGTTGLNIDFFTTDTDANNDTNPVIDPTIFETGTQTIYVRIESATSGCYAIATLEIFVNTLPVITDIDNFQICEDDNDQMTDFLFSDWDAQILNGQTGKEVFYFEDAALTIPIDKNTLYTNTSSPQTIHVRVENLTDPDCSATASFFIEVGANPVYNAPGSFLICDDASNDGIGVFDFSKKRDEMSLGSTTNLNIVFFATEQNAIDNIYPLSLQYTNTLNPEQIYVRIENQDSSCVSFEDFGINVVASPNLSDAEVLSLCDDDYDGMTEFNLDDADYENFDRFQTDITINYFENMADVDDDVLAIPNPNTYISSSKTVYIKVTNNQTTCYTVIPLELEVMPIPVVIFNGTFPICDNDTNTFDLSTIDDMLVDDASTVSINYYNSAVNAQNNTGALSNIYTYTSTSHVIHTRIENITSGCIALSNFTLQINPNPIANTPQNLIECDDDLDGFLIFDLTEANSDILGVQTAGDYAISYYSTLANAETKTDQLNSMHESVDGEIIFFRIENNATGCFSTNQFTTFVNPLPIVPIEDSVTLCLDNLPLIIDASTGNPNDTYLWSTTVNPSADNSTSPVIVINNASQIGEYNITITTQHANANNCSNDKTITVIQSEQATDIITTTTDFADPNRITVNVSGIGNYVYSLDGGEPQTSNIFENVSIGPHTVTIEDLNGCEPVTTEVFVIDIPKFVTPNGDNSFDTWHIVGIEQLPGTLIYIYNRHGKLLKMLPHNSPGWDGTFNGQNMPSDDYWFSADIIQNGESFNIRGHFALKR